MPLSAHMPMTVLLVRTAKQSDGKRAVPCQGQPVVDHVAVSALRYVPVGALTLAVLLGVLAATVAAVPALRRGEPAVATRSAARVLLVGAVLAVLAVTTMSGADGTGVNLTPGVGIRTALSNVNRDLGLLNLLGNVIMFVPVGFLMLLTTRLGFRGVQGACVALSVAVELLQLWLGRTFDVDDVLLNALGSALGAAAGVAVAARLRQRCPRSLSAAEREVASQH
jgi:hypothetical protein